MRNFDRMNGSGINNVFDQVYDMMDEVVRRGEDVTGISAGTTFRSSIPVDIKEEDGKEILKADLPGVEREDINIRSNSEEIEIWGTTSEDLDSNDDYQRRERRRKTFRRKVSWPKKIDEDTLNAWFEDGVLHVEADRQYSDTDVTVEGVDSQIEDGEDIHVD